MERTAELRWQGFLAELTWKDCLSEFLGALQHLEHYKNAFPAPECPEQFALALVQMAAMGKRLQAIISDPSRYEEKAVPEVANCILAMARRVRRDVPTIQPSGHA